LSRHLPAHAPTLCRTHKAPSAGHGADPGHGADSGPGR
jgi:hypothetical protein